MNLVVDHFAPGEPPIAGIPNTLARWYAVNSSIRRLWAVEDRDARLIVLVTLEPTSDGDDTLPVWLARQHGWTTELTTLTHREVHLQLIVSDLFDRSRINTDSVMIAELSWRDSWPSA